jgi:hypothetical protein
MKITVLLKAIYRFNAVPNKIPMSFFAETEKSILNFIWTNKRPQMPKLILSKKNNSGNVIILDFKLYYRASNYIKTAWY